MLRYFILQHSTFGRPLHMHIPLWWLSADKDCKSHLIGVDFVFVLLSKGLSKGDPYGIGHNGNGKC